VVQGVESLTRACLAAYQEKDIARIAAMFHPDVVLRDWNSEVRGHTAAAEEFTRNFEQADTLQIEIKSIYQAVLSAAAELKITVNGTEVLNVVDVLSFNEEGKILSIVAYRGL
jgi:ketosteroid isomerase-like protein